MATIASFPVAGRSPDDLAQRLDEAIARAQARLLGLQHRDGYWHAPLEANVGMDAQYVIFNRFMGRRRQETEHRLVERMQAVQSADGSWPLYHGGPGHLSTTIEAYFAMKLAGVPIDDPALARAREFIRAHGGLERAGVFTRTFLAYFGQFPWWGLPAMPVELVLLPPWFPLNIYAMSSWARGDRRAAHRADGEAASHRRSRRSAASRSCGSRRRRRSASAFRRSREWFSVAQLFLALDWVLKRLGRSPWKPLRARARCARAAEWILARQDRNGGWGGIQPPMLNCVMALRALGYPDDHPAVANGMQAIEDFLIEHDGQLFFQPCVSPTWDTALACKALLDSGVAGDASRAGARRRVADREPDLRARRLVASATRSSSRAAGRSSSPTTGIPTPTTRAVILMVLQRIDVPDRVAHRRALAHGTNWTLGMQSRNGGWGAFDTDNTAAFLNRIPFADMEAMIDPPTEDLTGRLLELMGNLGFDLGYGRARRAHAFLLRTQRADGSWWGRWGSNFIYGTWSVLAGLRAIGEDLGRAARAPRGRVAASPSERRRRLGRDARDRTTTRRSPGRGESHTVADGVGAARAARRRERRRRAPSCTASSISSPPSAPTARWDEDEFTGTGFPRHFYLRYYMYRDYFPLMALGQCRARLEDGR